MTVLIVFSVVLTVLIVFSVVLTFLIVFSVVLTVLIVFNVVLKTKKLIFESLTRNYELNSFLINLDLFGLSLRAQPSQLTFIYSKSTIKTLNNKQ